MKFYKQLGNKALAMMGASMKTYDLKSGSISFKTGRNAGKVTHIKISLTESDTYTLKFFKIRGVKVTVLDELENVYAEDMHRIIEDKTGMYLSL